MLESQAEYAVRAMKRMIARARHRGRGASRASRRGGTAGSSRKMDGTSWTMSNNYFKSPTGKVVTQWPFGCTVYRALTKLLRPHQRDHPPPPHHLRRSCVKVSDIFDHFDACCEGWDAYGFGGRRSR